MFNDEPRKLLMDYAAVKQQIKALEAKAEEMQEDVIRVVETTNPVDKVVDIENIGTFTMVPKRKYTYPADVTDLEEKVKQLKKESEAKGTALVTEQPYLKFTAALIN